MTETLLRTIDSSLGHLTRIVLVDLWSLISSNHTTIIVLVSIAIIYPLLPSSDSRKSYESWTS